MNFMGVEYEESCGHDYFQIAWPNDLGDKIESQKFCGYKNSYSNADSNFGTEFPAEGLTINSTEFELRWKSDWSLPGEGFELEWSCNNSDSDDGPNIPKIDPCDLSFAFKFSVFATKNSLSDSIPRLVQESLTSKMFYSKDTRVSILCTRKTLANSTSAISSSRK